MSARIPRKREGENILVGTWNLREFGGLTKKWRSVKGDGARWATADLPSKTEKDKFFDQIAWFVEGDRRKLTLGYEGTGVNFRFDGYVLTDLNRNDLSFRMSDHFPLWVEFLVPKS